MVIDKIIYLFVCRLYFLFLLLKKALRIKCGYVVCVGVGDGLTIDMVLYIVCGEDVGYVGLCGKVFEAAFRYDVAVFEFELVLEDFCVWCVVDGDEVVFEFEVFDVAVLCVFEVYVCYVGFVV